ncbi:MAG: hypothetical protein Q9169_008423, partial [Polycauliona sp. 2 TL-2023]
MASPAMSDALDNHEQIFAELAEKDQILKTCPAAEATLIALGHLAATTSMYVPEVSLSAKLLYFGLPASVVYTLGSRVYDKEQPALIDAEAEQIAFINAGTNPNVDNSEALVMFHPICQSVPIPKSTPTKPRYRIKYLGPITVSATSFFATTIPSQFDCDFIISGRAISNGTYKTLWSRNIQLCICWYGPQRRICWLEPKTLAMKEKVKAKWSVSPVVTAYSMTNSGEETKKATVASSYANASTQIDGGLLQRNLEAEHMVTNTVVTYDSVSSGVEQYANKATAASSYVDASTETYSTASTTMNQVIETTQTLSLSSDSHSRQLESPVLEQSPINPTTQSETNALLDHIARLESLVAQQRRQIEEQPAPVVEVQRQDHPGARVWANRSTTVTEEENASVWAEAVLISQATTIANQDRAIKEQQATTKDLRARQCREVFRSAGIAGKEASTVKQLQEKLQAEKDGRMADAKKAKEDMATTEADAAKALTSLQKQFDEEKFAVVTTYQTAINSDALAR